MVVAPSTCILAVDGGNSKTRAVVGDARGRILGIGNARGSNHQSAGGVDVAMDRVRIAARQAVMMAGIRGQATAAYFSLAGVDLDEDFQLLRPALECLGLAQRVGLHNDSIAILYSGTDSPNAVAVGWGAGTNGVGRNDHGQEIRLPSLGWITGDWGGGEELAREAVSLVARAHDGRGEATMLEPLVLETLEMPSVEEMSRWLYVAGDEHPRLIELPPLIFRAAEAGDRVAGNLVARVAAEVAVTAVALLRRLDLLSRPADVVLGGSIFKAEGALLLDTVRGSLAVNAPLARVVTPQVEPVVGALFAGMDMIGITVDEAVRRCAGASYQEIVRELPGKGGTE